LSTVFPRLRPPLAHHVDASLLPLCRAGDHEGSAFRLGQVVIFDILKVLKEPLLDPLDSLLFVRCPLQSADHRLSLSIRADAGDIAVSGDPLPIGRIGRRLGEGVGELLGDRLPAAGGDVVGIDERAVLREELDDPGRITEVAQESRNSDRLTWLRTTR